MGFIYLATCITSGHQYVGQTIRTIQRRWREHVLDAINMRPNSCSYLHHAIHYHGEHNFLVEPIWECDNEYLDDWEVKFIEVYDTFNSGYNLTTGGQGKYEVSDETKRKLSLALAGKTRKSNARKNPEDEYLPKYISRYASCKRTGFKVCHHPNMPKNANRTFMDPEMSPEMRLAMAIDCLVKLDDGVYEPPPVKIVGVQKKGPNGFRYNVPPHKIMLFNKFESRDENYAEALAFAKKRLLEESGEIQRLNDCAPIRRIQVNTRKI